MRQGNSVCGGGTIVYEAPKGGGMEIRKEWKQGITEIISIVI